MGLYPLIFFERFSELVYRSTVDTVGGRRYNTVFSGKVYERRFFELALYLSTVNNLHITGAPTVFTETEVFGNDGAFPVFQIIERFTEDFQPPLVSPSALRQSPPSSPIF